MRSIYSSYTRLASSIAIISLHAAAFAQVPSVDLNGTQATGRDYYGFHTLGRGPELVAEWGGTVTDSDGPIASMTATLTSRPDGTAESLSADVSGTSITMTAYNPGTGVLFFSGVDTPANYQRVLRSLRYDNTDPTPDTTVRTITVVANDGTSSSATATAQMGFADAGGQPHRVLFEDDFESGSLDLTRWNVVAGTPTISSGKLVVDNGDILETDFAYRGIPLFLVVEGMEFTSIPTGSEIKLDLYHTGPSATSMYSTGVGSVVGVYESAGAATFTDSIATFNPQVLAAGVHEVLMRLDERGTQVYRNGTSLLGPTFPVLNGYRTPSRLRIESIGSHSFRFQSVRIYELQSENPYYFKTRFGETFARRSMGTTGVDLALKSATDFNYVKVWRVAGNAPGLATKTLGYHWDLRGYDTYPAVHEVDLFFNYTDGDVLAAGFTESDLRFRRSETSATWVDPGLSINSTTNVVEEIGSTDVAAYRAFTFDAALDTAPIVDLNGSDPGANSSTQFYAGFPAVPIAEPDATLVDDLSAVLTGMTVTMSGVLDGASESLAASVAGTSISVAPYNSVTGVLSFSGTDSIEDYQTVLRSITYSNALATPTAGTRTISVTVTDGTFSESV